MPREDVFVTTKLWNSDQGRDATLASFDGSMERLGLDVLDLYLIHWPTPDRDLYVETWKAFQELRDQGRIKAIGVSNFQVPHLQRLEEETGELPALNQIELHPHLVQEELRTFHTANGIYTEAWSPLASGGEVLTDGTVTAIADAHGVTPAQAILRWHLQLGNVVIPKSVTPSRIEENFDVFGFELDGDDLSAFARLDRGERTGPDPLRLRLSDAYAAGSPVGGRPPRVCPMSSPGDDERAIRPIEEGVQRDFSASMSYGDYLGLDRLLSAQHPRRSRPQHDELLFIVQHQTSELWLKLVLHELRSARALLASDDLAPALKRMARVKHIQRTLTDSGPCWRR